jgi:hypothetical protein
MFVCYAVDMTEYESGFGQRADGTIYSTCQVKLENEIKRQRSFDSYQCYVRPNTTRVVIVNEELFNLLTQNSGLYSTVRNRHEGELGEFIPSSPKANVELFRSSGQVTTK